MLLTSHALTGVLLGTVIEEELILAPVAFCSHLVMDSLPHFGIDGLEFRSVKGFIIGSLDFAGALTVLGVSLMIAPERAGHVFIGWLGATLPDLFYLAEVFGNRVLFPSFRRVHSMIQWSQTPSGIVVDIVWALSMIYLLQIKL